MSGAAQSFILNLAELFKTQPSNTEEERRKKNNHKDIKSIKSALDTILLCPQESRPYGRENKNPLKQEH